MNKLLVKIIIGMLALASFQYAQNEQKLKGSFYFGASQMPVTFSGLQKVELSDHQSFPTNPTTATLDLSKGNRNGLSHGVNFGFKTNNNIPILFEAQLYPKEDLIANLLLGLKIYVLNTNIFQFGISPKIGFSFYHQYVDELRPVHQNMGGMSIDLNGNQYLDSEDPFAGDSVSARMMGTVLQATADFKINFTKYYGLLFSAGISNATYGDLQISIDRKGQPINLDISDPAIVEPGTTTNPNINPKIKTDGLYFNTSLVFNF